jgi:signal transduction histidine kinase/ligand-binding sensor domain-containing protein
MTWRLGQAGLGGTPTAITQTTDGYIWVGTSDGLYRFDGVRFTRWISQNNQRLPNQDIYSLLGARDGSLYIGTAGGLARLTQKHLYTYPGRLFNIRPLIQDQQGTIWMGQRGDEEGLHVLCQVGETQISCLGTKDGFEVLGGYAIFSDKPGSIWVGNIQGIDHWRRDAKPETFPFAPSRSNRTANGYVTAFAAGENGSLWAGVVSAGSGRGLLRFANGRWSSYVTPQIDGSRLPVRFLLADSGNVLWIGTVGNGLYKLRDGVLDRFDTTYGLSGDAVNGLFTDREGNLWVLTDGGIDVFRDLPILSFTTREGLSDDSIQAVGISANADVWIGTRHALNIIHDQHISSLSIGHGLPTDSVAALYRDSHNTMWMGDEAGRLYYYRDGQFTAVSTQKDETKYYVLEITEDINRNIWLTGLEPTRWKDALLRVDGTHIGERAISPDKQALFAAPHPQGGLWAGGYDHGLYRLNNGQFSQVDPRVFDGRVFHLQAESDGGLWIFTLRHDIFRYQDGHARRLTTQNGLPCDSGSQIVDDHTGSHWLYLACGVVHVRDEELAHWRRDPGYRMNLEVLDVTAGYRPGSVKTVLSPEGLIWSTNGRIAQVIDTRHLPSNTLPPPVHIERLVVDHVNLPMEGDQKLPMSPRELEIDYAGLSYVVPEKVRFRYRLEGHDQEWTDPGDRRQAFYNDLRPGRYKFQVIACNNDNIWNDKGATLEFTVPYAWYQMLWFRVLCVFLILSIAYLVYLWRIRQYASAMRIRFDERLEERTRLARDLHDTLLQTIQGMKLVADQELESAAHEPSARTFAKRISQWSERASLEGRAALDSLRGSTVVGDDLATTLRRSFVEYGGSGDINFNLSVIGKSGEMHPIVMSEVFRIGDEAIRNACVHSQGRVLAVELIYEENLTLRARDDGKGIDPETLAVGKVGHYGLTGMRERAARVGAKLEVVSSPAGTEIVLRVPGKAIYKTRTDRGIAALLKRIWRGAKTDQSG